MALNTNQLRKLGIALDFTYLLDGEWLRFGYRMKAVEAATSYLSPSCLAPAFAALRESYFRLISAIDA